MMKLNGKNAISKGNSKLLKQEMDRLLETLPSGQELAQTDAKLSSKIRAYDQKHRKFGTRVVQAVQSAEVVLANSQSPNIVN